MPRFDGFIGPSYQSESLSVDAEDTLNLFVESQESGVGKTPKCLYGTPGLQTFCTLPETPIRGIFAGEDRLFVVAGSHLYEVFADKTFNNRGFVGNDGLPAQMAVNGNQLGIASAGFFWCDNGTGPVGATFTEDSVKVPARQCAYMDGYFIVQDTPGYADPSPTAAGRTFFLSALLDGTTWSNLEFAAKEAYPDNLAAIQVDHEELYLFGTEESTEEWQDTGALNFPFQRDPGGMMHYGCGASFSVGRLDQGICWLALDQKRGGPIAIYAQGFIPQRVSTHAVEQAWAQYATVSDAISYTYIENGHMFWVINFPSGNATWVYDRTEQAWHRRGWWNGASVDRHRVAYHCYVNLAAHGSSAGIGFNHFGGDWQNGNIYLVSLAYLTDSGTAIRRQRTAPHLANEQMETYYWQLQLDTQTLDTAMTLEASDDGGHTWGNAKTPSSSTTDKTYAARTIWRRCGKSRTRTFRVTSMASIQHAWIGAYLKTSPGSM
jgi:hypothetical protein